MKKNEKIGILNFQYSNHNYGAVLQAAALENVIINLGYDVEHINFIPEHKRRKSFRFYLGRIKRFIFGRNVDIGSNKVLNSEVFERFRSENLRRTADEYHTKKDLTERLEKYSKIVVGSDQVWRPKLTGEFSALYFLSFASTETKRISYAASFGVDYWEDINNKKLTSLLKNEINKFYSISVREKTGVDICRNVFDVSATHVLDPTLLIGVDFFKKIALKSELEKEEYGKLVYYKLDLLPHFVPSLEDIAAKSNLKIENIYYKQVKNHQEYNSIPDWLFKLMTSSLVITDSFHCICFSILFEREFIYYPNKVRGMSRLESLLGDLGLIDRICYKENELVNFSQQLKPIDYSSVNTKISHQRNCSMQFLITALQSGV